MIDFKQMKRKVLFALLGLVFSGTVTAQVAINTDNSEAHASAMLHIKSTNKGFLIPRMTLSQRDNINQPATGLLIFCSSNNNFYYYNGSVWKVVGNNDDDWAVSGNDIYTTVTGNVGIGTNNPSQQLELTGSLKMPHTTSSTTGVIYKGVSYFLHDYVKPGTNGYNVFLGHYAGNFTMGSANPDEGSYNVGIGDSSMLYLTTGSYNTGMGYNNLGHITTGSQNTAYGAFAMHNLISGNDNVAIGVFALGNNTSGSYNTAIGDSALFQATGSGNIAVGYKAGGAITTGNHNIEIAYNSQILDPTGDDQLNIGNIIFGTGVDGSGSTVSTGNIGIGVVEPQKRLHVNGDVRFGGEDEGDYIDINVTSQNVEIIQSNDGLGNHSFKFMLYKYGTSNYTFNSTSNELMRFSVNTQKFGIGTNSPDYELQVNGTIAPETDAQDLGTNSLRWDANLNDAEIKELNIGTKLIITPQISAPTSPSIGDLYVNSTDHHIYCYLGPVEQWVQLDN